MYNELALALEEIEIEDNHDSELAEYEKFVRNEIILNEINLDPEINSCFEIDWSTIR